MKRIVAMLLAAAAVVCCAGCGAGAQATTMTEEDFYVYENGKVIMDLSEDHDLESNFWLDQPLAENQETKRGIHVGSTLKEVEEAYKGEQCKLLNMTVAEDLKWIRLGEDTALDVKRYTIHISGFKEPDGKYYALDATTKPKEKGLFYELYIKLEDDVVERVNIIVTERS